MPNASRHERTPRLAWLPLPLLAALELILYLIPGERPLGGLSWIPLLNLVCTTLGSLSVAALAAVSFLESGLGVTLSLGAGMLLYGSANVLANLLIFRGAPNPAIAEANLSYVLAGLLLLSAAARLLRPASFRSIGRPRLILLAGYGVSLLLFSGIVWVAFAGILPPFFVPGVGSTWVRDLVVGVASAEFALTASLLASVSRRDRSPFLRWCALGLALMAISMIGGLGYRNLDSLAGWAVRAAAYLGNVYLIVALFTTVRESGHLSIPLATLRETHQRYTSLVDTSPDAILVSAGGRYMFANPAAASLFGASAPEQLLGRPVLELVHPDSRALVEARLREASESDRPTPLQEIRLLRLDGLPVEAEATGVRVGFQGQPAVQVVMRDISQRKRAEQALRELNSTLERQVAERTGQLEARTRQLQVLASQLSLAEERERRRIADLLHDDLQQILAGVRYQLSSIKTVDAGTAAREEIERQVDTLLEQAIERSRRLAHELSPTLLHQLGLPAALESLAARLREQRGLEVTVETRGWTRLENEPLRILLYRGIQELLFNVEKHSGVKQAQVRLEHYPDRAEITVSDSGKGFDPESGRSGFGLLSLRERLSFFQGRLEVDSQPGCGSRFTLIVPQATLESPQRLQEPFAPEETPAVPAPGAGPPKEACFRLLLADDHRVLRQGLRFLLENQPDIQVIGEAADGLEAVDLSLRLEPDVVVMDISMPRLDGVEATRRIKAQRPEVRVIGLTMHEPSMTAGRMREAGGEAVFSKTGRIEELIQAIREKNRPEGA